MPAAVLLALLYLPLQGLLPVTSPQAMAQVPAPCASDAGRAEVMQIVVEEARGSVVPMALALAVAEVESNFRANAESPAGARGVMQIMPATARDEFGVAPEALCDPRRNVQLGLRFLERLAGRYDWRWELALSHYNAGGLPAGATGPDAAARDYVAAVMAHWRRIAAVAASAGCAQMHRETGIWPADRPVLDDFRPDLPRRRLVHGRWLDDFRPQVRWHEIPPRPHHR